jgi:tetratricopeptide (TPR) repeat protein
LAVPSAAQAPPPFAEALVTFTAATQGGYADEGPVVLAALEAMDRALAAWDEDIRRVEAQVTEASTSPPASRARLHAELGTVYLARGRVDDATQALHAALQHDPRNATASLLLGLLHDRTGHTARAAEIIGRAWYQDPSDPTLAYLAWSHRSQPGPPPPQQILDALAAWYARMPPVAGRDTGRPFPGTSLLRDDGTAAPLLPLARYAEGFRHLERGDLTTALAVFRERAAADPLVRGHASADPAIRRGIARLKAGQLPDALAVLRDAVARLDTTPDGHRLLGLAYWADYQNDQAVVHLRQAVSLDPGGERARLALARVLMQSDRLADAEVVLSDTIAALPDSAAAHWWLGTVYASLNRTTDAQRIFERAAALPALTGRRDLLATIARFRQTHADFDGAIVAHTARIRANLNDAHAHLDLARAYMTEARQDDAFVEYVAALLVDPRLHEAHVGIGQYQLADGRYDAAILALQRAVDLQPSSPEARYALALALRGAGRTQEAAAHLQVFNELQTHAVAERRRTMTLDVLKEEAALRTAEGAHAEAVTLWERIVRRQPESASHHAKLAASLAAGGRVDDAIARYERAATLAADPPIFRALAALYAAQGRTQESLAARERFERALLTALGTTGTGR